MNKNAEIKKKLLYKGTINDIGDMLKRQEIVSHKINLKKIKITNTLSIEQLEEFLEDEEFDLNQLQEDLENTK